MKPIIKRGKIPFSVDEIEDVRLIITAKGKNYSIIRKKEFTIQQAKDIRIGILGIVLQFHDILNVALEDIKHTINKPD